MRASSSAALAGGGGTTATPKSPSKWTAAATASLKEGPHRTMFAVTRERIKNNAVNHDLYLPRGSYAGEWSADKRHGFGTQTYASGDKYEGGWLADKPHGRGTSWKFIASSKGTGATAAWMRSSWIALLGPLRRGNCCRERLWWDTD